MPLLIENCKLLGRRLGSVLVEGGRVARVSDDPSQEVGSDTERLDANGGALLYGLADTHCHPFEYGWLKRNVDLRGTANLNAMRMRLSGRVQSARPGEWVTGMGWDQEALAERRMPNRGDIDDIAPSNPVALTRVCGHVALLNTKAIETLGFQDLAGAEFERDEGGALTGVVKERAVSRVFARIPRDAQACYDDLQSVGLEAARYGLTMLHCILSPDGFKEELQALGMEAAGRHRTMRFRVYVPPESLPYVTEKDFRRRLTGEWLRINGVKIYADGSLGARTAALREPYSDQRTTSGLLRYSDEELSETVLRAHGQGYQVIIHAIGDRAIEQALAALSPVTGGGNPMRHRIEHASLLPKDLRQTMAKLGIRASVQPSFITSDAWAGQRLGEERVRDLYPLRSMLEGGVVASGGSDSPVESLSPTVAVWAAMVRGGFSPEEALSLDQALSLYTGNARLNGLDEGGTDFVEGSAGDLTLLDSDIDGIHPAMFRKVGVAATIVGGTLTYCFNGSAG
jgi:predicted amidohydrolase YtcJ